MLKKRTKVSLRTLVDADDGELASEFDACLRMIEQDIRNRPEIEQPRKVTLTVTFKPGENKSAVMAIDVLPHIPKRGPCARVLSITPNGMEMGSDRSDPNQSTVDDFVEQVVFDGVDPDLAHRRALKNQKDRERRAAKKAQASL